MNDELMKASLSEATYEKKQGTTTSYYWKSGSKILPNRASINNVEITKVARKGRNLQHPVVGQFIATFTIKEQSPLKLHKPFNVRTQIWQHEYYPQFIGYGTIGISDAQGKVTDNSDTGDLVIFYSEEVNWQTIKVFYLRGMGKNPESMDVAFKFVSKLVNS